MAENVRRKMLFGREITHLVDGAVDLVAGTAGGIANVYSGQPLDTVKVKMQAFPQLYQNWPLCFAKTYKNEGIRGLYAGTTPALVANIAENAVLFTAYGYCQKAVCSVINRQSTSQMTPLENATSGSIAAFFAALVLCPTELVKCRLQSQTELKKSDNLAARCTPWSISKEMYRTEGVRSFFVGLTPTLAREIPGYFFFFGAYETCRYMFTQPGKTKDEIGLLKTALSGAAGGCSLWTVIFPADVVKSRMQIGVKGRFSEIFLSILKNEGVKSLYKGLSPTLIRTCISSACLFVMYENVKKLLGSI